MVSVVVVLLTGMIAQGQPAAAVEAEATDARPNAERPLTPEELLTIRGERERFSTWGATTLVAETVLERDRPLRAGDEWSGEGPAFGALPRAGAHPGDPLVLASKAVSARYPAADSPVTDLLAISDSRTNALRLEGTVEMPAGTYLTPIERSAIAAADPIYAGRLRTGEPAAIAPIVDPSLWSTVQTRRERRRTRTPGRIVKGRYALRLCCAGCGNYLFGDVGRYRHPAPTCEGFLAATPASGSATRSRRTAAPRGTPTRRSGTRTPSAACWASSGASMTR